LTDVDHSIGTKRSPQQDMKSNNVAQDDDQHTVTFKRRNHVERKKKAKT